MKARYKFRIYPTPQQQGDLAKLFGCVRVVWNDFLAQSKAEKYNGYNANAKALTQLKKTPEREWLGEVSSVPLQQSLKQLDSAFKEFFKSCKGKRKGKKIGFPKFKKRVNRQTATFTNAAFSVKDGVVTLAKIGQLHTVWSRELPSKPSSVTVIKDCANRYFLSFVVEIEPQYIEPLRASIGLDLGLNTFAVMSNGTKAESPDYSKLDRKIRKKQKRLAKQQNGSKRREKTRLQIAKLQNKVADKRHDFLHKLSTKVVSENQAIALENLNVSGMMKNRKLARAIGLQGWYEFRTLLEGKADKLGRDLIVIDRWSPTSQTCSSCGFRWGKLDLSIRTVKCLNCSTEHDRDENASVNIEIVGMGYRHDSKRTRSESKTTKPHGVVASSDEVLRITHPLGA